MNDDVLLLLTFDRDPSVFEMPGFFWATPRSNLGEGAGRGVPVSSGASRTVGNVPRPHEDREAKP